MQTKCAEDELQDLFDQPALLRTAPRRVDGDSLALPVGVCHRGVLPIGQEVFPAAPRSLIQAGASEV